MEISKITDLELAKLLGEQTELLGQTVNNVNLLKQELKKRMESNVEAPTIVDQPQ
jgi:uncharacterized coiled-coil protein SlyX